MFVVTVKFVIEEGRLEDFMPLMLENADASLSTEPGCTRFDVCQQPDRPHEIFLYELYVDAAAFETHKSMPHFLAFSQEAEPMITSKTIETYRLVGGG